MGVTISRALLLALARAAAIGAGAVVPTHLAQLQGWVTALGGHCASVSFGDTPEGMRGATIIDNKLEPPPSAGDKLIKVPAACGMSDDLDELAETPIGQAIGRAKLSLLQPDAHLALRLLHECALGKDSAWCDYIALLPDHVPVGRHISDESLLASRSDFVLKQSLAARTYAEGLIKTLDRLVLEGSSTAGSDEEEMMIGFDAARLGWALDIVHSRSLTVDMGRDDPRGVRRFLIPLVDFLNHSPDEGGAFFFDEREEPPCFVVELKEGKHAPQPTQQLWMDYGDKSCEELWLMYGFVPSRPTPFDDIELEGAYSEEDVNRIEAEDEKEMVEEKKHLLESNRYGPSRTFRLTGRQIDPAVVCALRVLCLTSDELRDECAGSWNRPLLHPPVSLANERRVASSLKARLVRLLEAEPTTLEEDMRLLDDDADEWEAQGMDLDDDDSFAIEQMRLAVQLRANRKQLLVEMLERLEGFLGSIDEASQDAEAPPPNLLAHLDDYMPGIRLV